MKLRHWSQIPAVHRGMVDYRYADRRLHQVDLARVMSRRRSLWRRLLSWIKWRLRWIRR